MAPERRETVSLSPEISGWASSRGFTRPMMGRMEAADSAMDARDPKAVEI